MVNFNKLGAPGHWKHEWTKHPQGYTILEALVDWLNQVNDMVDNLNDMNLRLDDFIAQYDENVQAVVADKLNEWKDDGTLDTIINDQVLGNKADQVDLDAVTADVTTMGVTVNATGDGATDNIVDFENALAELKAKGGSRLYIGAGEYLLSRPLVFDQPGIEIYMVPEQTIFKPTSNFTGNSFWHFKNVTSGSSFTGLSIHGGYIDMLNEQAHGITVENGYNGITVRNIEIREVNDNYRAYNFTYVGTNNIAGQTVLFENTYGVHAGNTGVEPVYYMERYQEVNFVGTKAFANRFSSSPFNGSDRVGACYHFKDCRGVNMTGCSQAFGGTGVLWESDGRAAMGLTIVGMTSESITEYQLHSKSTTGLTNSYINLQPVRHQGGAGDILLENVTHSTIYALQAGVDIPTGNSNTIFMNRQNNSAYSISNDNTVINTANGTEPEFGINTDIHMHVNANPTVRYAVDGTDYEMRVRYEATLSGDGDIVIEKKVAGAWVTKTRIKDTGTEFYDDSGTKIANIHASNASGYMGISVLSGIDGNLRRLQYNALDSGGTGLRTVVIPN